MLVKPYAAGDTYKPEDEVVYKFTVTNTEPVWRDEAAIQDIISNVRVEVIGDTTKSAFSESEISHVFTSVGTSGTQDTYIQPYDATDDLDLVVDIAPEEVIEFTVKGKFAQMLSVISMETPQKPATRVTQRKPFLLSHLF